MRRNVRFNEDVMDLEMSFSLNRAPWQIVLPTEARAAANSDGGNGRRGSVSYADLNELLAAPDMSPGSNDRNVNSNENDENKSDDDYPAFSVLNANARSLGPRINSLVAAFKELGQNTAVVTEAWLQEDSEMTELREQLSAGHGLDTKERNRSVVAANGRKYGGVAIVTDKNRASFKDFTLNNPGDFEVLAAVSKLKGIGKLAVIGCYIPPNYTAARVHECIEYVSDLIGEIKRTFEDCLISVAGDVNQRPIERILGKHPDMREVPHGPTRGDRKIDKTFVNYISK